MGEFAMYNGRVVKVGTCELDAWMADARNPHPATEIPDGRVGCLRGEEG